MIIKKIIFIAVLIAVCCACSTELDSLQEQESVQLAVTISDKTDSKTVASDNGDRFSVTWTGSEKVSVNGVVSQSMNVDPENPKRAVFTFGVVIPPYSSVYPASACKSVSGLTGTVTLPSEQKFVAGSFDPDAALMVGYSDQEGTLEFHHAVSYLLVNVITSDSRSFKSLSVTCHRKNN